ncbi:MAG TPA: hypothetical protein VGI86_12155 [Acidimicrobiia bacterium]
MVVDDIVITDELVRRVERELAHDGQSLAGAMRRLDPGTDAAAVPRAGGVVVHTGPGLFVNRAIGMGVTEAADADDVDFVIDFFDQRRMPAEIELCPYADDRLRARASERGFAVAWFRTAFTRGTDSLELLGEGSGSGEGTTQFELVDSRATFVQWAAVHRAIAPDAPTDALDRALEARNSLPGAHDFLARRDGVTVGVCSLIVHDGVATFGGMGVFPDQRARGVQADCVAFRLALARDLGADLALVTAPPGSASARNVERAGFVPRYTSACLRRPR